MSFEENHTYKDREAAGQRLAAALKQYTGLSGVVAAIPRGGVPVGFVIATRLKFKLDLALSKKIGHPLHKEYAIGAVSLTDSFVEDYQEISRDYIENEKQRIRNRLHEMYTKYMGADREPEKLRGKIVILTDDGLATGRTMLSTIGMVQQQRPDQVIVAVPVASRSSINMILKKVDTVICPWVPDTFRSVGAFYEDFEQVTDEAVTDYIQRYKLTL